MALVEHVSTTRPAVEIDGVTLNYFTPERETLALANVSLSVAPGEFIAIVGSSGCGKSTLLSIVSGLLPPSRGRYASTATRSPGRRRASATCSRRTRCSTGGPFSTTS